METNQTHIPPKGHPSLFDEPATDTPITDTPATDTAPAPQQAPGLVISYGSTVIGHALAPDASAETEQADEDDHHAMHERPAQCAIVPAIGAPARTSCTSSA